MNQLDVVILYKGVLESVSGGRNNERKDERVTVVLKQTIILQNDQRQTHLTENKQMRSAFLNNLSRMIILPDVLMRC